MANTPYGSSNTYTDTSGSSLGTSLVQAAYDRYVEFALRAVPLIRDVADKRPVQQAMPGSSVVFQLYNDLAKATTVLSETVDPDAVGFGNTNQVSVTLAEYGNAALATRKLELFSLSDVDPAIADIIAFNMADSIDEVAQTVLRQGPNVIYGDGSSTGSVTSAGVITSADLRKAVAKLRTNKAVPRVDDLYWCGIHPEVSHDLRAETGAGAWRDAHIYNESGAGELWPGSIGVYEGAMYVESPRLYSGVNSSGVQSYEGASTGSGSFTRTGSASSGSTTLTVTATVTGSLNVGNIVSGTSIVTGTRVAAISTDGLTVTLDTATSGAISSGTITFQPTVKVYRTLVAGKQALAEAIAEEPHVVIGPVVDKLMRFRPIGWYGVLGFARYRDAALYRIETTSSIAS
jgi:N4-gp56 family major capsid protein